MEEIPPKLMLVWVVFSLISYRFAVGAAGGQTTCSVSSPEIVTGQEVEIKLCNGFTVKFI
jgi:hypothetical protein